MIDKKIRIVIFGGLGFIGKRFATKLAETQRCEVNILDKKQNPSGILTQKDVYISSPRETKSIKKNDEIYHFYYNDGMDIAPPDIIFHFGEYARVEKSLRSRKEFLKVINDNVFGTWKIIDSFIRENPEATLFYAGSSTRFSSENAYTKSPYAFTKYMNSEIMRCMNDWFNLKTNVTYFYNVFGNGEELGEYGTVVGNFKKQFLNGEKIDVYGGEQTRRFTYIDDVCDSLVDLMFKSAFQKNIFGKEFHFFDPKIKETPIIELAKMFYDDEDMIKTYPMRAGCRMKSVDQKTADTLNTFGKYPTNVETYVREIKK